MRAIVDGVLTLYTSDPQTPHIRAFVAQLQATGREVFLQPLSQLEQKKKVTIESTLHRTLRTIQPN